MTTTTRRNSMIIIGGGLGGLSTGAYGQMNGYRTRVFEMHEIPGGCCTGWGRGEFTFDACISWLLGNGPGNEMHQIWLELGALQGKEMRHFDVFNTVRGTDGRTVYFYCDPDRLESHLLSLSPADARAIRSFCAGLRKFIACLPSYPFLKPVALMSRMERWRMLAGFLPYFNLFRISMSVLMTEYSTRFKDPLLRDAFNYILYEKHPGFPVLPFYFQMAAQAHRSAGVPEGAPWDWHAPSSSATWASAGRSPTTPWSRRSWSRTTGPSVYACPTARSTTPTSSSRPVTAPGRSWNSSTAATSTTGTPPSTGRPCTSPAWSSPATRASSSACAAPSRTPTPPPPTCWTRRRPPG